MNDLIPPHTTGESVFVDDIPEPKNTLQTAVFVSTIPHGKILNLDLQKARESEGVVKVLTYEEYSKSFNRSKYCFKYLRL